MLHFRSTDIGLFGRRQRHARGHRIPVKIVSGGAETSQTPDTAIVTDVFGATDVLRLPGGCACCTVRGELQGALRRLLAERERRHFTRVAIATSENLGPILRTFATERALGDAFYIEDDPPPAAFGIHAEGVRCFKLAEIEPLSWDAFSRFIATLTALRGADLLRVKGMLNIEGCRGPVVVQFVQHLAHAPIELQAWPGENRASRVAFVTRNVDEKMVRNLFDSIRALAPPSQTQTSS